MPRFAANVSTMFGEWPFLDRLDAAADAGFTFVECQFPYEAAADALASRLERNGLAMAMFNTPRGDLSGGDLGFASLPGRFEDLSASVAMAEEYALALGVTRVHLLAGRAPDDDQTRPAYRRSVAWAAERFGEHGIQLLIEPVNARDNPGYFLTDFHVAEALICELGLPNVRLQFDTYHRRACGLGIIDGVKHLLPIIGHIQVSSPPDRGEPDAHDIAFLSRLDALGYKGVVGCEYVPRNGTMEGLAWRQRLNRDQSFP